jgi:UDP-4-amino-4,6-dideoxy-L-N-acetyl-beta-L-altrosamine transaminase
MINLFTINNHILDTSKYSNLLHDDVVNVFENELCKYVGSKYAVTFNSATSAIFLSLLNKNITLRVPSMIPPVVLNAIITSGNEYEFTDNTEWVGDSYVLHEFKDYKIIDSAQKIERNQFKNECNPQDLMIFSFYPTKPIGGCDGGMIVSDDLDKILSLKEMALNGMTFSKNNWDRKIKFPGYKMYMNSIQCDIALRNYKQYENKLEKLSKIRSHYNNDLGYNNTSNHLYRINVNNREEFMKYMLNNNIVTGIHYETLHNHPVYLKENTNCIHSENASKKTVSIPFHENLSESDLLYIINKIKEYK